MRPAYKPAARVLSQKFQKMYALAGRAPEPGRAAGGKRTAVKKKVVTQAKLGCRPA